MKNELKNRLDYGVFGAELKVSEVMDWWPNDWRWEYLVSEDLDDFFKYGATPNDSIAELSNKFFEANKDNDMNLSKSKAYCLSSIEKAFMLGTLSAFEGSHFSDWMKARNILEILADYDLGDDTWDDYSDLVELAFEKGMEFGEKGPGGWDQAIKKFKQWSKGKAYSDTLKRRAKKQIKSSFQGFVKESFLTGFHTTNNLI